MVTESVKEKLTLNNRKSKKLSQKKEISIEYEPEEE